MAFILIFGLFLGFADGFIIRSLPPVLDQLMDLYGVSYSGISILLSAHMWSHAAIQVPGGMVSDRLGIRKSLFISMGCLIVGCVTPAVVPNFYVGVAGRFIAGIGTGLTFIVCMKMYVLNAPKKHLGLYQSLLGGVFSLGSIPGFYVLPKLAEFGWRMPYISPAVLVAIALALLPLLKLKPENLGQAKILPLKKVLAMRGAWVVGLFHSLSYGTVMVLSNWAPSVLAELAGQSTTTAFLGIAMFFILVGAVCRMVSGFVLLRIKMWTLAFSTIALIAVCYFLMTVARNQMAVVVLIVALAVFGSINYGAIWGIASGLSDSASLGTVLGFVNLLANLFTVVYTLIFGWSKDFFGTFTWALAVMTAISLASLILGKVLFSGQTRET